MGWLWRLSRLRRLRHVSTVGYGLSRLWWLWRLWRLWLRLQSNKKCFARSLNRRNDGRYDGEKVITPVCNDNVQMDICVFKNNFLVLIKNLLVIYMCVE
ncbi:hypothetical protein OESDEN_16987 [Oesophagostomum dentatum]|uniref:Uncharacterized protein n=1 Tax=Oesophagostomum dentatum TaxID=61180 RepID=A0A0B1SHE8_OESDE|nr:hypothetical protein OESDEN_16987 [Oesophagostomum dentatum]